MNYLSVESVSKSFGERLLFEDVSFGIEQGQKVGLISKNGAGKSSFLKILIREDVPTSGKVAWRKGIQIGYLNQEDFFNETNTIKDEIFNADNIFIRAIKEYTEAIHSETNSDALEAAISQMDAIQAWDYEAKMQQILGELEINDLSLKMSTLSGGQKKRIALAKVLVEPLDFIILDEPTNHLDIDMIEWLEEYLIKSSITLIMVTHDRYFLDRVCQSIIEIDNSSVYVYKGNYAYYLEKKQEREAIELSEIEKSKNLYSKELQWMRRMPQARATKAKSRIDSFYELEKKAKKQINTDKLTLEVIGRRIGGKIIELHNISKSFGEKNLIASFNYIFKKGDKIGIVGANGAGKSTLIKIITEEIPPDKGKVKHGDTIVIGYYSQDGMHFKEGLRIIDAVKEVAEVIPLAKGKKITASQLLERFLFPSKQQYTPVEKLSGGEKRRLYLLTILMANPNFLILDEPTNDLDIITLNILEDFLSEFAGCVLVITHDRFFMDKIVDSLFIFKGEGRIDEFNGTYSEYKEEEDNNKNRLASNLKSQENKKSKQPKSKSEKLTYNDQRELQRLEKKIAGLEERKKELLELLASKAIEVNKLSEYSTEYASLIKDLEAKEMRWLELSDS